MLDVSSTMTIGHLILTRYNITFWDKQSQTAWRKPEWLEDRLRLFFRYTFPSVAGQDVRAFTWLVFIHPETPAWVRQQLERDRAAANMHLVETPFFDPKFAAQVAREHAGAVTHLVTTTLDNDDALARSFVGEVQRHVRPVPFELINCVQGLRLVERSAAVYHCRLRANPFVTAVETLDQARTIWAYLPHGSILKRVREVRDVATDPLWLQVVHDRNLAPTGPWGLMRTHSSDVRRQFALGTDVRIEDLRGLRLWPENVRRWLERRIINRLGSHTRARLKQRLRRSLTR